MSVFEAVGRLLLTEAIFKDFLDDGIIDICLDLEFFQLCPHAAKPQLLSCLAAAFCRRSIRKLGDSLSSFSYLLDFFLPILGEHFSGLLEALVRELFEGDLR